MYDVFWGWRCFVIEVLWWNKERDEEVYGGCCCCVIEEKWWDKSLERMDVSEGCEVTHLLFCGDAVGVFGWVLSCWGWCYERLRVSVFRGVWRGCMEACGDVVRWVRDGWWWLFLWWLVMVWRVVSLKLLMVMKIAVHDCHTPILALKILPISICLSTSSYPLDSYASTHGNQDNEYEEIGHRNEDGFGWCFQILFWCFTECGRP